MRASDVSIVASESSRPKKCSGTRIGTFDCAILPGNGGRGVDAAGAAGDFVPPGNGPRGGFLAGSRKALRRARASSSVMPCKSQRFLSGLHGSMQTGSTKFPAAGGS